ncbi:GNAT family N-acetyltransferase [Pseudoalteromonas amylolytica]|nr:GNAT family N-acetyltransferase [Pseudoalteromonas amylolytica]
MFLFERDFMDYHSDRFADFSLMIYEGTRLLAVLPLNRVGSEVYSHGGLTFGGMVFENKMSSSKMIEVFLEVSSFLLSKGLDKLTYKAIPHIYHSMPSQEDLYCLTLMGANLVRRELSSVIDYRDVASMSTNRKRILKKSHKYPIEVVKSQSFERYWLLLESVVSKYGVRPTHTHDEIKLLAARFPNSIHLYEAELDGELQAGVVVFDNKHVVHTQYLATSESGKENGALDLILSKLISEYQGERRYFSFGISTENAGQYLNMGLVRQKEGFGARTIVHDTYEVSLDTAKLKLEAFSEQV